MKIQEPHKGALSTWKKDLKELTKYINSREEVLAVIILCSAKTVR